MAGSGEWIVEAINLTRTYGDGETIYALNDVNFRLAHGELVAVMGPSGSGKSTLLNVIGALDRPSSGKVLVDGQDVSKIRNKDRFRAKTVGFMFQLHNLLPTLNAMENVEVPMQGQVTSARARRRPYGTADRAGLGRFPHRLGGHRSGLRRGLTVLLHLSDGHRHHYHQWTDRG